MKYFFSLYIILCSLLSHGQVTRLFDSTLLINGNGTVHYLGSNGKNFGFTTYKNGHPDGLFNLVDSTGAVLLIGQLKYDSSCIQYHPPGAGRPIWRRKLPNLPIRRRTLLGDGMGRDFVFSFQCRAVTKPPVKTKWHGTDLSQNCGGMFRWNTNQGGG